ncbi:unnamed protein product [Arctia plantaginis]|uniref:Ketosynthase family 3 (KS3) domain-containing protein n=1 Tax=Arctia plantaginis TaxID=874455 RepID=A0A8S1BG49_ARCPL|nr:unnamed protein product [Arctia plantaginis]
MTGEEVVISGISGIFPKSDTVLELKANLFNQINMVEEVNYDTIKHPNLPQYLGKMNNLHKFDAQFFRVTHWQADSLDPLCRKVMECAFSAIYDSGTNPLSLSGNKLGVFIGSSYADVTQLNTYDTFRKNIFIISGSSKAVLANRISYWIDSKAPSLTIDQGCASSMACLELAYDSIKRGDCEAALVGGCNACVHPGLSFNLKSAGHLCLDGKTKCFDKKGDGYVRSEAISLLFLQKAKDAKRIYTEIVHIKGKYFTEPDDFLGIRKSENIEKFLQEFYSEVTVSPSEVEYVEACGLGIAEADRNELDAIGRHFAKSNPVKVGCIKSNMGHTEAASGVCAITKEMSNYQSNIPRLILLSGREDNGLNKVMDMLINQPINPEQISLLHNIYKTNIPSHTGRSYLLLDSNQKEETECLAQSFQVYSGTSRPVWFLYSGMGSQWCGMGAELLKIPVFAAAIERCRVVLEPLGIDILHILTGLDESMFDNNITYSMLAIVAMQIGLTDVLKAIGIVADNYIEIVIGHSLGEAGCAYADGCLTVEEAILLSYFRGIVAIGMPLIRGSMAAVGLGYKDILPLCPPEIDVACHNSASSSTLSGPADIMNQFVSDLVSQGFFAKEVPCSNIAYHSRYVHDLAPKMMAYLKKLIRNPKLRSHKWISTLFLKQDWEKDIVKYASAEYFTSGLTNPVVFEENATEIPQNAIVIEIAPHGLLQSIIRRSHSTCTHISLTKRDCPSPINFLLEAVGKLHQEGLNLKMEVLYPKVEFPVSTCTPLLSHLVEWEHSTDWPILTCKRKTMKMACAREVVISLHDDDYKFIKGYARNGIYEFPESALLVLVWQTLGMREGNMYTQMSIAFKDIIFHNRLEVELEDVIRLRITIGNATNRFEVINRDRLIVSGFVEPAENDLSCKQKDFKLIPDDMTLKGDILYNILNMKGYSYSEEFHCIHSINTQTNVAYIKWNGEWATFIDSLLQVSSFSRNHDGVSTPKVINNLSIQVDEHKKAFTTVLNNTMCYKSEMLSTNSIRCGGIQIGGVIFDDNVPVKPIPDVILARKFMPENFKGNIDINTAIFIIMQLVANNVDDNIISVTEILTSKSESMIDIIKVNAEKNPFNSYEVKSINIDKHILDEIEMSTTNLFIAYNTNIHTNGMLRILIDVIKKGAFTLTLEENIRYMEKEINYNIITRIPIDNNVVLILLKKRNLWVEKNLVYITIDHDIQFSWLRRVLDELHKRRSVILVSEKHPACGLLGLIKCLRQDKQNQIRLVIVEDNNTPSFNPDNAFYKQQLEKNLAVNVYKKVHYAGPSSRDCLKAIGKVPEKSSFFGMDFSGTNGYGERVMGLVSDGAIRSTIKLNQAIVWPVPTHWSLEDAATVPLPYMYAYYCLAAMKCVAFVGLFLDVSESDMRENMNFGMYYLSNDKSYMAVNISAVFRSSNNDNERKVLQRLVADGIVTGAVRPLSRVIFSPLEISRAFQLVSSKMDRGKVLVKMDELETSSLRLNVIPSSDFSEGTHIIVCEKGNLGVNIIDYLVSRGAKNILVHLKSRNEYLLHKLIYWKEKAINIQMNSANLQTREGCNKLINAGEKLGCIKSIFIVHDYKEKVPCENFDNDFKLSYLETFMITANLDSVSRNISSLSYFAVIGTCSKNLGNEYAMSACDKICEARRNIGLPGLILRTINPNKLHLQLDWNLTIVSLQFIQNSSNEPLNTEVLSVCYTLDVGMKMNYENVIICNLHKKDNNSFNIDKILALSEIDNADYNLPLEKLNVSNSDIEKIRLELKPILYPSEDLLNLTPLSLNKLWNKVKGNDLNCHKGLGVFYNYLDANECNVMDLFVPMKTLIANYEDYGYMDRHKSHLIMIPGFDGYSYTLSSVAERLKISTVTLQLGPDVIFKTIPDMAKYLADQIKLNFEISSRFYLLGYSFGVNIALEVAKIFETEGRTGVIYCLDSSPDALKSQIVAYLGNVSDEQLQNIILEHMYYLMTGQKSIKLKEDLQTHFNENWSVKVDICMRHLRGMVEYSFDFQKFVLESAYNRIKLAKTYECNFKLQSELILIRGIHHPKAEELGEDYNLSKYTESSVRVFPIESDHASAPYNNRISNIINKILDPSVLEDFKQENLCEFYCTE